MVNELNTLAMVGEGSIFIREPHVPVTHPAFSKPPVDAFVTILKTKDRRSVREWDYVNSAGVWADMALAPLSLARTADRTDDQFVKPPALAERALKAVREVLCMRAQYFKDITGHGMEMARQISFLVRQGSDAVFSDAHRSAKDPLTAKIETEAAKTLVKARLEAARNKKQKEKRGRRVAEESDEQSG